MPATHRNRLVTAISNTPGTTGALTIAAAASGYRTFGAGDNGLSFDVSIVDGTAWEIRTGCVYTHSGTSLSRGTLEDSSTGSAISLTSAAVVTVTMSAGMGNALGLRLSPGVVIVENNDSTTQAIAAGTFAKVTTALTTEVLDSEGWWDNTNKKFQPSRFGKYLVSCAVALTALNDSKVMIVALHKNGLEHRRVDRKDTGTTISTLLAGGSAIVSLNGSTDYIELYVYNGDSVSRDTEADGACVWFTAMWVSE